MNSLAVRQFVTDTEHQPARTGTLSNDFCLPGSALLRVSGPSALLPPSLWNELGGVARCARPDGHLLLRPRRHSSNPSGLPVLMVRPAPLRAPRIPGRPATLHSLTLEAARDGRPVGWAERILEQEGWFTPELTDRARRITKAVVTGHLGGTWWGSPARRSTAHHGIVFGARDSRLNRRILAAAIEQHGAARTLLVMDRPGALAGICRKLGIGVLDGVVDPWPLLEEADCIHVSGDDEAGILARLLGTPVRCHSPGLLAIKPDPARLAAAALLLGARYADPVTGHPVPCETFLEHMQEWRRQAGNAAGIACCVGISFWKRRRMTEMLGAHRPPAFRRTAAAAIAVAAKRRGSIAVWASRVPPGLEMQAASARTPLMRIEDGFIRSVGLGADFLPPLSIVLDRLGLYYDATRPSDLEAILAYSRFDPAMLRRAALLRARLVHGRVTKYNVDQSAAKISAPAGRRVLLVPGQVADDRSVLLGGGGVRPGLELLAMVRDRAPTAYIVYKPHPDVLAGHRAGAVPDADALRFADQVVRGGSMAALLETVDEIHTLTSLTGFEALLRYKPVTTYGQPFYAGWGLTEDINPIQRRNRRLALDELVAGTLILYPRYIDPVTSLPCTPETVIDRIADPGLHGPSLLVIARRLQGRLAERLRKMRAPTNLLQKGACR